MGRVTAQHVFAHVTRATSELLWLKPSAKQVMATTQFCVQFCMTQLVFVPVELPFPVLSFERAHPRVFLVAKTFSLYQDLAR